MPLLVELSDKEPYSLEELIKLLLNGDIKENEIYDGTYFHTADALKNALIEGMGETKWGDPRNATLWSHHTHNVYAFSRAKNHTELLAYRDALLDENGKPVSYGKFRQLVIKEGEEFNDHYLRAEYNSARRFIQMRDKWDYLQKLDVWEYRTIRDDKVRKLHKLLDGKRFKKDDPIWEIIFPPNDWGCRCNVVPAQGMETDDPAEIYKLLEEEEFIQPYFQKSPGTELAVFGDDHPYFKGSPVDLELQARNHYGMRSTEQIFRDIGKLDLTPRGTAQDDAEWLAHLPATMKTQDGVQLMTLIAFGKFFKRKSILAKRGMTGLAATSKTIMEQPDEVWSRRIKGKIQITYIKYYQGEALIVVVSERNGLMEIQNYFKSSSKGDIEALRMGELKHRA